MKLRATIDGRDHEVILDSDGSHAQAEIDGRRYEIDSYQSGADSYLIICDTHVFDCRAEGHPESGKAMDIVVDASHYAVTITDPKRLPSAQSSTGHDHGSAKIVAPMPGKVVRVLVEVGAVVEAGAGIMVVEAMKMQNEMKAPKSGTVVSLNAAPGETVNAGAVLAVIE